MFRLQLAQDLAEMFGPEVVAFIKDGEPEGFEIGWTEVSSNNRLDKSNRTVIMGSLLYDCFIIGWDGGLEP